MSGRWLPVRRSSAAPAVAAPAPPVLVGELLPANAGPDVIVALLVRARAGDPAVAGLMALLGLPGGRSQPFLQAHRRRVDAGWAPFVPTVSWRLRAGLPQRSIEPPATRSGGAS